MLNGSLFLQDSLLSYKLKTAQLDIPAVDLSREFMDFTITDKIKDRLDFLVRPTYKYIHPKRNSLSIAPPIY